MMTVYVVQLVFTDRGVGDRANVLMKMYVTLLAFSDEEVCDKSKST